MKHCTACEGDPDTARYRVDFHARLQTAATYLFLANFEFATDPKLLVTRLVGPAAGSQEAT